MDRRMDGVHPIRFPRIRIFADSATDRIKLSEYLSLNCLNNVRLRYFAVSNKLVLNGILLFVLHT